MAQGLERKAKGLGQIKSKLLELQCRPNKERVYLKKLSPKTIEFAKKYPLIHRVHSYDIDKGHSLYKVTVNDLQMEGIYGTKSPVISLSGETQGWDIFLGTQVEKYSDFWVSRFDSEVNRNLHLPEGVDDPIVYVENLEHIYVVSGKMIPLSAMVWEERYSENDIIYDH